LDLFINIEIQRFLLKLVYKQFILSFNTYCCWCVCSLFTV